jgi:hypothetical protein
LNKNTNEFRHGSDYLAVPPFAPSLFILVLFGGGILFEKVWRWGFGRVSFKEKETTEF